MTDMPTNWADDVRARARRHDVDLPPDVIEELAGHLEEAFLRALDRGESIKRARAVALDALDDGVLHTLRARQRVHLRRQSRLDGRAGGASLVSGLAFDLQYAVRLLRRNARFSLSVIGILALGIGASAAAWSVVHAVLLRPLPYPAADRLVLLNRADESGRPGSLSSADWADYATRVRSLEHVAAYANWTHNLSDSGEPARLRSAITTGRFFAALGVTAALGRVYGDQEDQPDAPTVVVLSDGLWTRSFGRDPAVIGRAIVLNGRTATVIGVMPSSFAYPSNDVDLWMPIAMSPELRADRAGEWLQAIARVRDGLAMEAAQSEVSALAAALAADHPKTNDRDQVRLVPLRDHVVGEVRPAIRAVALAVLFVFLVTCLNTTNLLLARASVRHDEMAVRLAVGADRARLARQMLAEMGVLTGIAAGAGLVIGWALLRGLTLLASTRVPRLADLEPLATMPAATGVAALVALGCCGVAALGLLGNASGELGRHSPRVARGLGVRPALLTLQIACSFVLLSSGGLLAGSYVRLQQVPAGFDADNVLSLKMTLPRLQYPDNAAHVRFADALRAEIARLPGVTDVGLVNDLPLAGNQMSFAIAFDDRPAPAGAPHRAIVRLASPGYFSTLRIPLLSGRALTADDRNGREHVVLVNRAASLQYWAGAPLDRRIRMGEAPEWWRIIGVAGDIRQAGPLEEEGPVVYVPYAQKPFEFVNWLGVVVRGPSVALQAGAIKAAVAAVDPSQPVYDVMPLDEYRARAEAPFRLNSWVVGSLAVMALLLAVAGVAALTSYSAALRQREFGVRLALGAMGRDVLRLVLGQAARLVAIGTVAGAVLAIVAARWLTTLLFGLTPHDPSVLAAVALVLFGAALAAALPAARRSARLDPSTTIRVE